MHTAVLIILPLLIQALPTPCTPEENPTLQPQTPPQCKDSNNIQPKPDHATVHNSCNYTLNLWSISPTTSSPKAVVLNPGESYDEPLQYFTSGGVSLKISKTTLAAPITQFEYTADSSSGINYGADSAVLGEKGKDKDNDLWYNISFVNCATMGQSSDSDGAAIEANSCPGHASGIRAFSGEGCKKWDCSGGGLCDGQAYYEAENGGRDDAPVAKCGTKSGVVFEVCSGMRGAC